MPADSLDDVMRRLNNGALPSSEATFVQFFCQIFGDHTTYNMWNPWTTGRTSSISADNSRLRVRFRWGSRRLEVKGIDVRNQIPPSREAALKVSAAEAWRIHVVIREDCFGGSVSSGGGSGGGGSGGVGGGGPPGPAATSP